MLKQKILKLPVNNSILIQYTKQKPTLSQSNILNFINGKLVLTYLYNFHL